MPQRFPFTAADAAKAPVFKRRCAPEHEKFHSSYHTHTMNLAHLLLRAARAHPHRLALARGEQATMSFAELAIHCAALAGAFRHRLRLAPGDRIALFMNNRPEYLEVMCAAWWAGLVVVPVNAKLHPSELSYIIEHSGARLVVTDAALAPAVELAGNRRATLLTGSPDWYRMHDDAPIDMAEVRPETPAWLFYTSGTTGRPKGVTLTHRNLMVMSLGYFCDVDSIACGDCIIHAAPMSHGSGLYILPHLAAAATQVTPASEGFEAAEIFSLARHYRGATLFAAPTMVRRLTAHARAGAETGEGLKTIVYGGGPMYGADIRDALDCLGQRFVQIYGQGESPMTITVLSREQHADVGHPRYAERLGSVGLPHTGVEVRILDETGRALPAGTVGEVAVRGDVVMSGYWCDRQASARTLADGWLHTGDLGRLDEDGFLTLIDRSKDLIISGGSNIYPREVEEILLTHPAVAEAAVIGRPDPEWGEQVIAYIVLAQGSKAAAAELDAHCLNHIARFKRPRHYRFVDVLPKNNYGKVLKRELRQIAD